MTRILFRTIGSPIGCGDLIPSAEEVEQLTKYAFKSRVGLLFLDECIKKGVELGEQARELHESLTKRRDMTDRVVVKLARALDEVAAGEWVLFKSIKPFASTPNDTDWFPLDRRRHKELCDHLQASGEFKLLEVAPRQTTLIEAGGVGVTDTTKRGGVFYIDCYVCPSTDYFVYLDASRLRPYVRYTDVLGQSVPILAPHVELAATMFHSVFPERSFSHENYYLVKAYLDLIECEDGLDEFVSVCREHQIAGPAACHLAMVRDIDDRVFQLRDERIAPLLDALGHHAMQVGGFDPLGSYPCPIPNKNFWLAFAGKQRDPAALRSTFVQLGHMFNPVFLADVLKIIWRRSVKGGVYEQN
jgi:hypothetical protein